MTARTCTIAEMFDYQPGNHGLTEEIIYDQQPVDPAAAVPVFGGSSDNARLSSIFLRADGRKKSGDPVVYFDGPCLILTKDGRAGLLTYKGHGERFTLNHHACVLRPKPAWKDKLDLVWFAQQFQSRLFAVVTSKSDNHVFSTDWFDRMAFVIPSPAIQKRQREKKQRLESIGNAAKEAARRIREILCRPSRIAAAHVVYDGPVSKLFEVRGGNGGLTEQFIYHHLPLNEEDAVEIRSGATMAKNAMGQISRSAIRPGGQPLKVFESECLLVTRKGFYAGTASYWPAGAFAPNDDINALVPTPEFKEKINLQWFAIQYASVFRRCVSSMSDNATFNQGWLERIPVTLPDTTYQEKALVKLLKWQNALAALDAVADESAALMRTRFPN